jgi:hypothetical protein
MFKDYIECNADERSLPNHKKHRPVAQLGLTSYGTWELLTTGYSRNEDTPELSGVATDSPEGEHVGTGPSESSSR